ncbi:MAG: aminopeptidase N [Burkholderiales bacterium]|nr:aminopeptidase N [Burkholderiales bacterium]
MPLRQDYLPYPYTFSEIHLSLLLDAHSTQVRTRLLFERKAGFETDTLVLDGEQIELISIALDGKTLSQTDYVLTDKTLTLHNVPKSGELVTTTTCAPIKNTSLSGLFATGKHLMTQCEAEGFRRITYFADRPDVLTVYTVELIADKVTYPVLLANGNLLEAHDLDNGLHRSLWHDPFPKPSYLFAVVAGQLAHIEETIEHNGQSKLLQVYVEPHDIAKAQFALDSLKASMKWDLARYGLPLDLERFMIVATSDFNMGAMENKGLNIFNTKFVLAHPDTSTDVDFEHVEAVVGHEYFHNWTGNRVTCQDWFQLSLKEGLTVYRDQEFTADQLAQGLSESEAQSARAVQRIGNVMNLCAAQFMEDAGPMAHPIRPNAYEEINNFYTMTVYEKGAEVVRMYETLLGRDGFRRGMDEYFKRHDGQAVTCDDFRMAMADANGMDLTQFARWYEQAGTPRVHVQGRYDAAAQTYTLTLSQSNPAVGIELEEVNLVKPPLHIPFNLGLIDSVTHTSLPLNPAGAQTLTLNLTETTQSFVFEHIPHAPIPSLNRNFGAPIQVQFDYSEAELLTLLACDTDAFNRWDAGQQLFTRAILRVMNGQTQATVLDEALLERLNRLLNDMSLSPAYRAVLFTLPSFATLSQRVQQTQLLDPQALFSARETVVNALAKALASQWQNTYNQFNLNKPYEYNGSAAGERSLKNLALSYWAKADAAAWDAVQTQYHQADNMTDRYSALNTAIQNFSEQSNTLIEDFYQRFANEALVIDKWFTAQATRTSGEFSHMHDSLTQLMAHPAFTNPNPNRLRSLIFAFCNSNPRHFHQANGAGYQFWAEQVLVIDAKNPQVASRLARTCEHWRTFAEPYQAQMKRALTRIAQANTLSDDTREIVHKALRIQ